VTSPGADSPPNSFAAVSAVVDHGAGRFGADVSPEWTIGGKPNGGYLLSMLGRAGVALSVHGEVIAASAHYLRAPEPGPVELEAEVLREGRSASQVRARLLQDGQPCVEALLMLSDLVEDAPAYWDDGLPARSDVTFGECVPLEPATPDGMRVNIMGQVEVRLEPATRGFRTGEPGGRGELRGWLSLPGGAPFDPYSLLFAVDAFPPATFDIEFTGWVPTLELTVYVRARPAPGPVRVLQRVQLIAGQRFDETCFVWDSRGTLVAQSTQLAGIRLG
jgi:hypothetical protein